MDGPATGPAAFIPVSSKSNFQFSIIGASWKTCMQGKDQENLTEATLAFIQCLYMCILDLMIIDKSEYCHWFSRV